MKKVFFSLMALAAVSLGFVACDADDAIMGKLIELVAPKYSNQAGVYESEDGFTIELTESGNYIYTGASNSEAAAVRGAGVQIYTGTFTVTADDEIILEGDIKGNVKNGKVEITEVGGDAAKISLHKKDNVTMDDSEEAMKLCRTWNVEEKAEVDGKRVTISDAAYAKYFGSYGYPKQLIISRAGTFCVVCANTTYAGTWKLNGKGKMIVEGTPLEKGIPYNIGEKVTIDFAMVDGGTKHVVKATLNEVK